MPDLDKSEAQPFYGASDPMMLHSVDRVGHPPLVEGGKPALALRFYFTRIFEDLPFHITFLMDPDGAVEENLIAPETAQQLLAHFSPQAAAESTPEESING